MMNLFGYPQSEFGDLKNIGPNTDIYLYNLDTKEIHGIFRGIRPPSMNIVLNEFYQDYPAQINVKRIEHNPPKIIENIYNWKLGSCNLESYKFLKNIMKSLEKIWECQICTMINITHRCEICGNINT
jgi:hypothetical protein